MKTEKPLTKEQFRQQFRCKVNFDSCSDVLRYSETFYGYKIFRALQLLVLQDIDGSYWVSRLS